jgi:hypothetical protein
MIQPYRQNITAYECTNTTQLTIQGSFFLNVSLYYSANGGILMSRYFDNKLSYLQRPRLVNALNFNKYKEGDNYHVAL